MAVAAGQSLCRRCALAGAPLALIAHYFQPRIAMNESTAPDPNVNPNAHRDPITGTPGAHPVGTGVGAFVGGAAAGAVTGAVGGPVGSVVGAVVGAVLGGLAGKQVAEGMDPTVEDAHWREHYASRPYVNSGANYDDYGPAYGYGVSEAAQHPGLTFEEVEPDLGSGWDKRRGTSSLQWDQAKNATRDAWHRVSNASERALPGDSDRDGK
jgi:hypothetical protein